MWDDMVVDVRLGEAVVDGRLELTSGEKDIDGMLGVISIVNELDERDTGDKLGEAEVENNSAGVPVEIELCETMVEGTDVISESEGIGVEVDSDETAIVSELDGPGVEAELERLEVENGVCVAILDEADDISVSEGTVVETEVDDIAVVRKLGGADVDTRAEEISEDAVGSELGKTDAVDNALSVTILGGTDMVNKSAGVDVATELHEIEVIGRLDETCDEAERARFEVGNELCGAVADGADVISTSAGADVEMKPDE